MAGVSVDGGGSGRKSVDSDVNMIPFIDLLMVTISFLLITAVWTQMARLNSDAQVPGPPQDTPPTDAPKDKTLHIEMRGDTQFTLIWKQGNSNVSQADVPRNDKVTEKGGIMEVRYPELGAKIESEWKNMGTHKDPSDLKRDQAVLHVDNTVDYFRMVGVLDAIYQAKRDYQVGTKKEQLPAFNVTFAMN